MHAYECLNVLQTLHISNRGQFCSLRFNALKHSHLKVLIYKTIFFFKCFMKDLLPHHEFPDTIRNINM